MLDVMISILYTLVPFLKKFPYFFNPILQIRKHLRDVPCDALSPELRAAKKVLWRNLPKALKDGMIFYSVGRRNHVLYSFKKDLKERAEGKMFLECVCKQ